MTNPQKNKLSMFLAVLGVLKKYETAWRPLAGLADLVKSLGDLTAAVQASSGVQGTPLTGITSGKNRKQVEMIERTMEVADDLHAVAVTLGDDVLASKTDLELTDLVRMQDVLVGPYCRTIYDLALPHTAALAGLGTTAQDLAELDAAITVYLPLATAPRVAKTGSAGVTGDIDLDVKAAMLLLNKQLDKALRKFKRKNAEFFNAYTSARIIVDLGGGRSDPEALPKPTPPQ